MDAEDREDADLSEADRTASAHEYEPLAFRCAGDTPTLKRHYEPIEVVEIAAQKRVPGVSLLPRKILLGAGGLARVPAAGC